jgi:hypothetical protein
MQYRMTDVVVSPSTLQQDMTMHEKLQSTNMYQARRVRNYYHPYVSQHKREQQAALQLRAVCLTILCLLLLLALLWLVSSTRPEAAVGPVE